MQRYVIEKLVTGVIASVLAISTTGCVLCDDTTLAQLASPGSEVVATATRRGCGSAGGDDSIRVFVGRKGNEFDKQLVHLVGPFTAHFSWPTPKQLHVVVRFVGSDSKEAWPEIERQLKGYERQRYGEIDVFMGTSRKLAH